MIRGLACSTTLAFVATLPGQKITTLQFDEQKTSIKAVWYQDVSGDGRRDLVVAATARGEDFARTLRIHLAKGDDGAFAQQPDIVAKVPKSVSAAAIGDVHSDPGSEVIWFGARGAYVWRPRANDANREQKLAECEFLFQQPVPRAVLSWQAGVRDVDGDGRVDLVLPEPAGYALAMQRRDPKGKVSFSVHRLRLPRAIAAAGESPGSPVQGRRSGGRFDLSLRIGGRDLARPVPLVRVEDRIPAPRLVDFDGDGDLDVIALRGERMFVWAQTDGGGFGAAPTRRIEFPIPAKQSRLDARFSATLVDFDRNRQADAVLLAKAPKTTELITQVMFFAQKQGSAFFQGGRPGQLLQLRGFTSAPTFPDLDGDGTPDMHITSWLLDATDQLTGSETSLDIEIHAFLNRRGRFKKCLEHSATIAGDVLRDGGDRLTARFLGDVTGDRTSDLLVRDRPNRIRVMMVKRRRDTLRIIDKPIFELAVSNKATLAYPVGTLPRPAFLVLERSQMLLVRF